MKGEDLRGLRAPGEDDAKRRAWELAVTALEGRDAADAPAPSRDRRARSRRALALAGAATVAVLLAGLTPPGNAVAGWLGDAVKSVVDEERPPARASDLDDLPGGGRVLALADGEPWMAGAGERRRLVARAQLATWSPHGRFVAAARGNELVAVDLRGDVRWSLTAPARIEHASWSPDGFRVAYATGAEMRLVAGDGSGDRVVTQRRVLGGRGAFTGLTWRPRTAAHVLAYVDRRRVWVVDTDRRRVLWSARAPGRPRPEFSPDGRRLLLTSSTTVRVLAAGDGRPLHRLAARPGTRFEAATWSRSGRSFAFSRRGARGRGDVLVARPGRPPRRLFTAGALRVVAFSPDDRWVLVDWTETGTWLFLPVRGGRARQLTGVARRFGARAVAPQGWCCPP